MKWAIAAIATICLCGCARERTPSLDEEAGRYVRLALAVGARDPDSLLGAYAGPPGWLIAANRDYRGLDEVRRDLVSLGVRLRARDDRAHERPAFLIGQVDALVARIDVVRGARWPFAEEATRLFGVRLTEPPLSHESTPAAAPEEGAVIPPGGVKDAFERALSVCREETRQRLPLPADERAIVEAEPTPRPWPAFTTYLGAHRSRIAINTAFRFTRADLAELACHEGYPGHHAIYVWQDDALVQHGRIEFWIEPLFSPQAFLDEAAASYAPSLVPGIVRDPAESTRLDDARLAIAWRYLDGEMEFARAADALDTIARTPGGPFLKFVNEYRTYVAAYTAGRAMVAREVEPGAMPEARWERYREFVLRGALARR